jgi:hypothetical protein
MATIVSGVPQRSRRAAGGFQDPLSIAVVALHNHRLFTGW